MSRLDRLKTLASSLAPGTLEGTTSGPSLEASSAPVLARIRAGQARPEDLRHLEAIILPGQRPALRVENNTLSAAEQQRWPNLIPHLQHVQAAIRATVRIGSSSQRVPFHGTAFLVSPTFILTNRHVANSLFSNTGMAPDGHPFQPSFDCWVQTQVEGGDDDGQRLKILGALWIHPYWDAALIEIEAGIDAEPLALSSDPIPSGRAIVVVGHPYVDARNDSEVQKQVFGDVYGVKRVQPGYLGSRRRIGSGTRTVNALTHDASTLGGNSGSPVVDLQTGEVVALHFGGVYLDTNYAVPLWELARDTTINASMGIHSTNRADPEVEAAWDRPDDPVPPVAIKPALAASTSQDPFSWYERTPEASLRALALSDPKTLSLQLTEALGATDGPVAFADLTALAEVQDAVEALPSDAPEIIWLHDYLGCHLSWRGRCPRAIWLNPTQLGAADIGSLLRLEDDGITDANTPPGTWIEPAGHIGLFYDRARRAWERRGFVVHAFSYDFRRSVCNAADALQAYIDSLLALRPGRHFALVAHGMGGPVALAWAARHPDWADPVHRLVMLGAPVAGGFAPLKAIDGTGVFHQRLAQLAPFTSKSGLQHLARTSPGLLDLLASPTVFDGADALYARKNWAPTHAPSQAHLDRSRALKQVLERSPLLARSTALISLNHGTSAELTHRSPVMAAAANAAGDGVVPGLGMVLPGLEAYRIESSHAELPNDPQAIEAVLEILLTGEPQGLPKVRAIELQQARKRPAPILAPPLQEGVHAVSPSDIRWLYAPESTPGRSSEAVLAQQVIAALDTDADDLHRLLDQVGPALGRRVLDQVASERGWSEPTPEEAVDVDGIPRRWADWLGGYKVTGLNRAVAPPTVEDAIEVVQQAAATGLRVKATASGHSDNDLGQPVEVLLNLRALSSVKRPTDLKAPTDPVWTDIDRSLLVRVGAGTTVATLNERLLAHEMALPNMGSYDGQQVAGALCTGTHGSGATFGPMADFVRSIDVIGQDGVLTRYEAAPGITDPADFAGPIVLTDWQAMPIHIGALGVVTSLVLEVRSAYDLAEIREINTWAITQTHFRERMHTFRNYEILVHPYATASKKWRPGSGIGFTTVETKRWIPTPGQTGMPVPDEPEVPDDPTLAVNGSRNPLLKLSPWIPRWLIVGIMNHNRSFVKSSLDTALSSLKVPWSGGEFYLDRSDRVLKLGVGQKAHGFEIAVPLHLVEQAVDTIHEVAQSFYALDKKAGRSMLTSPFSLRFVQASDLWIAPQNRQAFDADGNPITVDIWCMIEMPRLLGTDNPFAVTHEVERRLKLLGCRPHWGQSNNLQRGEAETLYPTWPSFEQAYHQHNSSGRFSNAFTGRILDGPSTEGLDPSWDPHAHVVTLGTDGHLTPTSPSPRTQIARIFDKLGDENRLVLYAHGGLVDEAQGGAVAQSLTTFLQHNGAGHPIFVVWKTGAREIAADTLRDVLHTGIGKHLLSWVARALGRKVFPDKQGLLARVFGSEESLPTLPLEGLGTTEAEIVQALQADVEQDPETERMLKALARHPEPAVIPYQERLFPPTSEESLSTLGALGHFVASIAAVTVRVLRRRSHPQQWTHAGDVLLEEIARELHLGNLGRAGWERMKTNAAGAYLPGHGGTFLMDQIASWLAADPQRELHLGCHSAGSFHAGAWLRELSKRLPNRPVVVQSLVLWAPACDHRYFEDTVLAHRDRVHRVRLFAMTEEAELNGQMLPKIYRGSLLCLVSGLAEPRPGWPILGMERFLEGTPAQAFFHTAPNGWIATPTAVDAPPGQNAQATTHGGFDDDPNTRKSWLSVIEEGATGLEEGLFGGRDPVLPSQDPRPKARARQLSRARKTWQYDATALPPLQSTLGVPQPDRPSARWLAKVAGELGAIAVNEVGIRAAFAITEAPEVQASLQAETAVHKGFVDQFEPYQTDEHKPMAESERSALLEQVMDRFGAIAGAGLQPVEESVGGVITEGPQGRPSGIDDYKRLFQTLSLPEIAATWMSDETFAWSRVAGPNARHLQQIDRLPDHFPVTEAQFQATMGTKDSLQAAGDERRLFLGDWAMVGRVLVPGKTKGVQKYIAAPLALFAQPRGDGRIQAIAIQCGQVPDPDRCPIFTPADGLSWTLAKSVVTTADTNYHEMVCHLARTHLFTEVVLLATRRHLAELHPINRLLAPHFEGTVFINHLARTNLIAPGGAIDAFFAGQIETAQALAVEGLTRFDFEAGMLPNLLKSRGTEQIRHYPYREDAMLLWDAIHAWVTSYVKLYYRNDGMVGSDVELSAWVEQLQQTGPLGGLPAFPSIDTRSALIEALTHILFLPSCQHAAVNFPQKTEMTYAPANAGAGWRAPPTGPITTAEQLAFMPPLELARQQVDILELLGSIHHTKLGDYDEAGFPYSSVFADRKVKAKLTAFRKALLAIEDTIEQRNKQRFRPYVHLLPSRIPMGINI